MMIFGEPNSVMYEACLGSWVGYGHGNPIGPCGYAIESHLRHALTEREDGAFPRDSYYLSDTYL